MGAISKHSQLGHDALKASGRLMIGGEVGKKVGFPTQMS